MKTIIAFTLGALAGWLGTLAYYSQEPGPKNGYELEARLRGDVV